MTNRTVRTLWAAAVLSLASTTVAQADTWDGGGENDNWSTAANWAADAAPANDGSAAITLASPNRLIPLIDQPWSINSLLFDASAGAFSLGGQPLTIFGGGVVNNSFSPQTITAPIAIGAPQTWTTSHGALTLAGPVDNQSYALTVSGSQSTTLSGSIGGTGNLVKSGTGLLRLSEVNTFAGGVDLAGGTIEVSRDANLGTGAGAMRFAGGTLSIVGDQFGNSLRPVSLGSGSGNININSAGAVVTLSGNITGTGNLTKVGAGTLVLAGANSYSGVTQLREGVLQIGSAANLAGTSITIKDAVLRVTGHTATGRPISLAGGGGTIDVSGSVTATFQAALTGQGALIKTGPGAMYLNSPCSYSGNTEIRAGTLGVGAANVLPSTAVVLMGFGTESATLNLGNQPLKIGGLATVGTGDASVITSSAGTAVLEIDTARNDTFNGQLTGPLTIAKHGTGTLTLLKNNTYTGKTILALRHSC